MIELILIAGLAIAIIYAWWKGDDAMSFDEIMELKWLFKKRKKKITFADIEEKMAKRGVCAYVGQRKPWRNDVCECKGYKFERMSRGTPYCYCGDQMIVHKFVSPASDKPPMDDIGD